MSEQQRRMELALRLARNDRAMLRQLIAIRRQTISLEKLAQLFGRPVEVFEQFEMHDADPPLSLIRRYALGIGVRIEHHVIPDGAR